MDISESKELPGNTVRQFDLKQIYKDCEPTRAEKNFVYITSVAGRSILPGLIVSTLAPEIGVALGVGAFYPALDAADKQLQQTKLQCVNQKLEAELKLEK
jgi:hypothetical protein